MSTESTELLSVVQAAEIAGCEKETVYRAVWKGHLPARRRGNPRTGRLFIRIEDLNQWIYGRNYADERIKPKVRTQRKAEAAK